MRESRFPTGNRASRLADPSQHHADVHEVDIPRGEGITRVVRAFGDTTLALVNTPAGVVRSKGRVEGQKAASQFRLLLAMTPASFETGQQRFPLRRGDMVLVDIAEPATIASDRPMRWFALSLPRRLIENHMAGAFGVAIVLVPRDGMAASLFRSSLLILWRTGLQFDFGQYVEMAEATVEFLMQAITEALQDAVTPEAIRVRTLVAVSTIIYRNLSDPSFGLAALLAAMGMQAGGLKRLLGAVSPIDLIRNCRMSVARRMLRSGAGSHLSIGEIARRVGFGNLSHFSASYLASYGVPPTLEKRRQAQTCSDPAVADMRRAA